MNQTSWNLVNMYIFPRGIQKKFSQLDQIKFESVIKKNQIFKKVFSTISSTIFHLCGWKLVHMSIFVAKLQKKYSEPD